MTPEREELIEQVADSLTEDQCIELAMALERAMVRKILKELKTLNNFHERTDPVAAGWCQALEEFEFRVNEKWAENPCNGESA